MDTADVLERLADVLVRLWPADRLLVGMGACKRLRDILLNAPHAVLSLHPAETDRRAHASVQARACKRASARAQAQMLILKPAVAHVTPQPAVQILVHVHQGA